MIGLFSVSDAVVYFVKNFVALFCFVDFSAICLQTIPKPWEECNGFYAAAV